MRNFFLLSAAILLFNGCSTVYKEASGSEGDANTYRGYAQECAEILIQSATDRYGDKTTPVFVSILDVESRECPADPLALDEKYRVDRRERRNPAGANLLTDQPLLEALFLLSERSDDPRYAQAAEAYMAYYMENLVDEKGLLWWGWHRHYDVFKDSFEGHQGNHHEIHTIQKIAWDRMWAVNPEAVHREIEAIWEWHVIDKDTGEINRHGDKKRGCDFSMSGGSHLRAFAFLYSKTKDPVWLERARLLATYYYDRRNPETDLFPERPNAGSDRFDGTAFATSITGCHCSALLDAAKLTGDLLFSDYAVAYLMAYAKYGYDESAGMYYGALNLDGSPIPGPREATGYAQYEPRGHLDLWEPYAAGYQFPIYTAETYLQAYDLTNIPAFLEAAERFADWIARTPPGSAESEHAWYGAYSDGPGKQGTYAGKYGRTISFLLHLYEVTGDEPRLEQATTLADEAIEKLYYKGLFRGHPAKPYYEAMDGIGYLLTALLELDEKL